MEIGNKIHQLRKLSGITQEQLAEKLNISRQTLSKWESGATLPDVESVAKISKIFQVSLDELLLEEETKTADDSNQITLQDLMNINLHNRKMTLLLTGGLIFIMAGILSAIFMLTLYSTTASIQYMLYRYIAVGEYAYAKADYSLVICLAMIAGVIGIILCICYWVGNRKGK